MTKQPLVDFGGAGPTLHLASANGFPPNSYKPMLEPLTHDFRVVSLPYRALWPDPEVPPEELNDWQQVANDMLCGMTDHNVQDVLAVGHSIGGVVSMMAVVNDPARFKGLILLDPTILPDHGLALIRSAKENGFTRDFPLARGARRRHAQFADEQDAFDYWRARPLFADWSDDVLWAYTRAMLKPSENEEGLTLAWPPVWEARYYETIETEPWDIVAQLPPDLPILAVAGGASDTFLPDTVERFQAEVPQATIKVLPGQGHLFPHAAPTETCAIIAAWCQAQGLTR